MDLSGATLTDALGKVQLNGEDAPCTVKLDGEIVVQDQNDNRVGTAQPANG